MTEKEIIEVFMHSQEPEFYERIIVLVGAKFADIVKVGENIEDRLKTGKIIRLSSPSATFEILRKRKEDVSAISGIQDKRRIPGNHPRRPTTSEIQGHPGYHLPNYQTPHSHYHATQCPNVTSNHQSPLPDCSHIQPAYQNPSASYPTPNYQAPPLQIPALSHRKYPNNHRVPPPPQNNYNPPHPNTDKRPPREFTQLAESRTKIFEKLLAAGLIQPIPSKAMDVNSRFFRSDQTCAYHSNSVRYDTEDYLNLKHRIQDLIDRDVVVLRTVTPNVNKNPLPDHGGNVAGMTEREEDWYTAESGIYR